MGTAGRRVGRAAHVPITSDAPAKLTLTLRITGVRDDGYHLIDAEMVTLDLADTLTIEPDGDEASRADGPFADGVPLDDTQPGRRRRCGWPVARAAVHLAQGRSRTAAGSAADRPTRRPCCAGPATTDLAGAARLGADVPFCLVGGRARVRGIGEVVEPLPFVPLDAHARRPAAGGQHTGRRTAPGTSWAAPSGRRAERPRAGGAGRGAAAGRLARPHRRRSRRTHPRWRAAARRGSSRATTQLAARVARGASWCTRAPTADAQRCRRSCETGCGGRTRARSATCRAGAGGACGGASSCASSCACACGAS